MLIPRIVRVSGHTRISARTPIAALRAVSGMDDAAVLRRLAPPDLAPAYQDSCPAARSSASRRSRTASREASLTARRSAQPSGSCCGVSRYKDTISRSISRSRSRRAYSASSSGSESRSSSASNFSRVVTCPAVAGSHLPNCSRERRWSQRGGDGRGAVVLLAGRLTDSGGCSCELAALRSCVVDRRVGGPAGLPVACHRDLALASLETRVRKGAIVWTCVHQ